MSNFTLYITNQLNMTKQLNDLEKLTGMSIDDICSVYAKNVELPDHIYDDNSRSEYLDGDHMERQAVIYKGNGVRVILSCLFEVKLTGDGSYDIVDVVEPLFFVEGKTNLDWDEYQADTDFEDKIASYFM